MVGQDLRRSYPFFVTSSLMAERLRNDNLRVVNTNYTVVVRLRLDTKNFTLVIWIRCEGFQDDVHEARRQ